MSLNYLVIPLILLPLYVFSQSNFTTLIVPSAQNKNTDFITFSNEVKQNTLLKRNVDYPTQIIRMEKNIEAQQVPCERVHQQIEEILIQHIVNEQFIYAFYIACQYNPETNLAVQFTIRGYFDPLSDEAITYLDSYLREYNNSYFLGSKYKIESAKGLIISLNIASGMKKSPDRPPFIEYRKDRSNFFFKNNYEMRSKLYSDIHQNFFTPDPDKVLPFLNKWIFEHASAIYKAILIDSNYVELEPEKIFLMENNEVFVSELKQYFVHYCEEYERHRCLKPTS